MTVREFEAAAVAAAARPGSAFDGVEAGVSVQARALASDALRTLPMQHRCANVGYEIATAMLAGMAIGLEIAERRKWDTTISEDRA